MLKNLFRRAFSESKRSNVNDRRKDRGAEASTLESLEPRLLLSAYTFTNAALIDIVDNANANPYPSEITVAGTVGNTLIGAVISLREEQFRMSRQFGHIIVMGYDPGSAMLLDLLLEQLPEENKELVIISDRERPPDVPPRFSWVKGDPTKQIELRKVRLEHASKVVVVASRITRSSTSRGSRKSGGGGRSRVAATTPPISTTAPTASAATASAGRANRVRWRTGRSQNRNIAAAATIVIAVRGTNRASGDQPVRSGVSHKKTGQCSRYTP